LADLSWDPFFFRLDVRKWQDGLESNCSLYQECTERIQVREITAPLLPMKICHDRDEDLRLVKFI